MNLLYHLFILSAPRQRKWVMNRYGASTIFALLIALFCSGSNVEASLPEGLDQKLRIHNFNLYFSPCAANDMILQDMKGMSVNLSSYRGKVVLLNFWRIDCPSCSLEKPILERIFRSYSARGLVILAVNLFDPEHKQRSYLEKNRFNYTFAFDPGNRFSIRNQGLTTKIPTCFVVNSNSEAIYEIAGVPTTYVINRKGQVVGNSVGLVNWEESPFVEFLESLLNHPSGPIAEKAKSYDNIAGHGSNSLSAERLPSSRGPVAAVYAQAAPTISPGMSLQGQAPSSLPFQPPVSMEARPVGPPPASPSPALESTSLTDEPAQRTKKPARSAKKPEPNQSPQSTINPPGDKSLKPASQKKSPRTVSPISQGMPQQPKTGVTVPDQYLPPSISTSGATGRAGSLPTLPPALPYVPSRPSDQAVNRGIFPDQGTVTARVPAILSKPAVGVASQREKEQSLELPSAQQLGATNPIDGFILDSFGHAGLSRPQLIKPGGQELPPSSVFGQVGQDIKQLGTGIRETFSRLLPGW